LTIIAPEILDGLTVAFALREVPASTSAMPPSAHVEEVLI